MGPKLFAVSALFTSLSAPRSGGTLGLSGGLFFLVARAQD